MSEGSNTQNPEINKFHVGGAVRLPAGELQIPQSVKISKSIEMRLGASTIPGENGEQWNDWLIQDVGEYQKIDDPTLKLKVRLLARRSDEMNTPDHLEAVHHEIEELIEKGLAMDEAGIWLNRIEQRQRQLVDDEKKQIPVVKTTPLERAVSSREQPLHVGAVFEGGRNITYVDDPESILILDLHKAEDRQKFIFRNINTLNNQFLSNSDMSVAWLSVERNWEADIEWANKKKGLGSLEIKEFKDRLRAMMAVTASARAMEASAGASVAYMVALTGGERGNTDWQDLKLNYILHAKPSRLNMVINDPQIKPFYDQIMRDAGLKGGGFYEWREFSDPDSSDPDKVIQVPSKVEIISTDNNTTLQEKEALTKRIRENSPLIKYLKKSALLGGINEYIKQRLLVGIPENDPRYPELQAAAKIACDSFMIDKYTRWEEIVTDGGKNSIDIQPIEEWGGDPFKAILKPTFLPRLKNVYTGSDSKVLDLVDFAFRPEDIYFGLAEDINVEYGVNLPQNTRLLVPSAVTNFKSYARYNQALDLFIGGPMSNEIPAWTPKTMNESLPQIANLISQLYKGQSFSYPVVENGRERNEKVEVGKHICAAIMSRALYAKALAATLETKRPGFADKMEDIFSPENKTRPFLDVISFLYGVKRDNSSGFYSSLAGGRLRFVFRGNLFDAEKFYKATRDRLLTNDQVGITNEDIIDMLGFVADVSTIFGRNTGVITRK